VKKYYLLLIFISVLLIELLSTGVQMGYANTTGRDVFVRLDSMADDHGKGEIVVHDVPYGNNELEYSIILPGDWSVQKIASPQGKLSVRKMLPIGIYIGERDGAGNPRIQIQAVRVDQTADHKSPADSQHAKPQRHDARITTDLDADVGPVRRTFGTNAGN